MKNQLLQIYPTAIVTEKRSANGDVIVYVNGQTAFNKEDRHNAENWLNMMINALKEVNNMETLTLKQYDIAETLLKSYDAIEKLSAIKYIKSIFGSTAEIKDIIIAYKYAYEI